MFKAGGMDGMLGTGVGDMFGAKEVSGMIEAGGVGDMIGAGGVGSMFGAVVLSVTPLPEPVVEFGEE